MAVVNKLSGGASVIGALAEVVKAPINLACDYLRAPLNFIKVYEDKRRAAIETEVKAQYEKVQAELEIEKAKAMQDLAIEYRKKNAEIDNMIADEEFKRHEKVVEAVKNYQITMGEACAMLAASIGKMSLELRADAGDLILKRSKEYQQIQNDAMDQMCARVAQIEKTYPQECAAKTMMMNMVEKQVSSIIEASDRGLKTMTEDMAKLNGNIDVIARIAMENCQKYLEPNMAKLVSQRLQEVKALESGKE